MVDVLFYAGDPGSAGLVRYIYGEGRKLGLDMALYADANVQFFLGQRGVDSLDISNCSSEGLLKTTDPKIVICGTSVNPRSKGLELICEAKKKGVITVGIVDAIMSAKTRFSAGSDDPFRAIADYLMVPNQEIAHVWRKMGVPASSILNIGHPHYQSVYERCVAMSPDERMDLRQVTFAGLSDRKVLVFVAEPVILKENITPRIGNIKGWNTSEDRVHLALQALIDAIAKTKTPDEFCIVLKLHPRNDPSEFASYQPYITQVVGKEDATDMIISADGIVGVTSSLLLEAAFSGNSCLSVITRQGDYDELPELVRERIQLTQTDEGISQWLHTVYLSSGSQNQKVSPVQDSFHLIREHLRKLIGYSQGANE